MSNPFLIPDKLYNFLKQVNLIALPAISTLYFTLGSSWGWDPETIAKVVASIAAIEVFLGAMLGITTRAYNKSDEKFDGVIHSSIEEATGVKLYSLELNEPPEALDGKSSIIFKVDVGS